MEDNLGFELSNSLVECRHIALEPLFYCWGSKTVAADCGQKIENDLVHGGFVADRQLHFCFKLVSDARMTQSNRCRGQAVV